MNSKHPFLIAVVLSAALVISTSNLVNATTYTLTDLGTAHVLAINDSGQMVGLSAGVATIWNGTIPTTLGMLAGGTGSAANAINNSGQIVGSTSISGTDVPTVWNGTVPTPLSLLPGGTGGVAYAINSTGQIAGVTYTPSGEIATIWNGTTPTALNRLSGTTGSTYAYGINNSGQVVGFNFVSGITSGTGLATIWNGTTPTALGMPAGATNSTAFAVNDNGRAAGWTFNPSNPGELPTIWNGTTPTVLGLTPGMYAGTATAINEAEVVVGNESQFGQPNSLAFIWENGRLLPLNALLDSSGTGWVLEAALGINNLGQIIGEGYTNAGFGALLLTPCNDCVPIPCDVCGSPGGGTTPIPAALPLFATGLGLMGLLGWRRKRKAQAVA